MFYTLQKHNCTALLPNFPHISGYCTHNRLWLCIQYPLIYLTATRHNPLKLPPKKSPQPQYCCNLFILAPTF
ncbi:hypothetical protein C7N43_00175 [Sphingobacteriales bacterium UPWRP_1]|nr:hypothetical protein BVG80_15105 [Sphingobacteriales bacterium TSM_CSM]PSJ79077.1 hypothetical protein C7N43_00175 [Sphingobacteriales bacterium UPWRP_1]